jgi:hypothetical protein
LTKLAGVSCPPDAGEPFFADAQVLFVKAFGDRGQMPPPCKLPVPNSRGKPSPLDPVKVKVNYARTLMPPR